LEIVAQEEESMQQLWRRLERKGPPKIKTQERPSIATEAD